MKDYIKNQEGETRYEKISAANYSNRSPIFNPMHMLNKSPAS
jgi:hypothetical protein